MLNYYFAFRQRFFRLHLYVFCSLCFLSQNCYAYDNLVLQSPLANERSINSFPQFTWSAHTSAFKETTNPIKYVIQISSNKSFTNCLDADTLLLNRYVCDKPLTYGNYFWRVRALSYNNKPQRWSAISKFSITPPDVKVTVNYDSRKENNQEDVQAAIDEAIDLSQKGKSVEIFFPKGNYKCQSPTQCFMQIKNSKNIHINGNGSTVNLLAVNQTFCRISNSQNVIIKSFVVDFPKQMTFTQGRVTALNVEKGEVEVKIESNFPTYDDEYFTSNSASPVIPLSPDINGRIKSHVGDNYYFDMSMARKIGERLYTLPFRLVTSSIVKGKIIGTKNISDYAKDFSVGDRFIQTTRGIQSNILYADNCSKLTSYDITNYAVGGMAYVGFNCSGMVFLQCKSLIKDGRWWQGNADGIHLRSNRIGPWIEHCEINGIGDDAIALYSRPMTISKCFPDGKKNTLIINAEHFYLEPQDQVTFFNPRQGKIMLETRAKSILKSGKEYLVEFEHDLPSNFTIDGTIRDVDQIWNRSLSCGDFMIRNNTFSNIRRFGTVFRAKTGIIENNTYSGCSSSAIAFINETPWPNGLYCSDIIIRNNVINDCAFSRGALGIISITFRSNGENGFVSGVKAAESYGPNNILIENNVLSNIHSKKAIDLWSVKNVVIRNNLVDNRTFDKNNTNHFSLINSENVRF